MLIVLVFVRCVLFVVRCSLCVVCCVLFVIVCCVLFVCALLAVVWYASFVVGRLVLFVFVVRCYLLFVVCRWLSNGVRCSLVDAVVLYCVVFIVVLCACSLFVVV